MRDRDYESELWIKYELKAWIRNERQKCRFSEVPLDCRVWNLAEVVLLWLEQFLFGGTCLNESQKRAPCLVRNQLLCYLTFLFKPPNFIKRNLLEGFVWSLLLCSSFRIRNCEISETQSRNSVNSPLKNLQLTLANAKCKCPLTRILIFIVKSADEQMRRGKLRKKPREKIPRFNRWSFGSHAQVRCPVVLI